MRSELLRVLAVAEALHGTVTSQGAIAQEPTPGFNTKIPESILTPESVQTRVGTLEFFDGTPTKEAAAAHFATKSNHLSDTA